MSDIGCWNCGNTATVWLDCDYHPEVECYRLKCLNCNCSDRDCENEMEVAQ